MRVVTNADEFLPISEEGYTERSRELERLRDEARRELAEGLRYAREDGDLADNLALQDLLEEQAQLEQRIALLEAQLAAAEIVSPATDGRVGIGSVVSVRDGAAATHEYELVGPLEADVDSGRVSIAAPVGQALLGRRAGARVDVTTPGGPLVLDVICVRPRVSGIQEAA